MVLTILHYITKRQKILTKKRKRLQVKIEKHIANESEEGRGNLTGKVRFEGGVNHEANHSDYRWHYFQCFSETD